MCYGVCEDHFYVFEVNEVVMTKDYIYLYCSHEIACQQLELLT